MPTKLTLIRLAERVARPLRQVGLGPLIDKAAGKMNTQLGSMDVEFEGFASRYHGLMGSLYWRG